MPVVRRRGRGHGGYAAMRVGEAKKPGPPEFWGPLLAATVNEQTSTARYGPAVVEFLRYVQECGEDLFSKDDADYWLAHYIHVEYAKVPTRGTRKGHCRNAVYGLEHFYPAFKPLTVSRRCIVGWDRLLPPTPYAPMHLDVACACGGHVPPRMPGRRRRAVGVLRLLASHLRSIGFKGTGCGGQPGPSRPGGA